MVFPIQDPYILPQKRFGGYISDSTQSTGGAEWWPWTIQNWSTEYPNWILPFMKNLKRLGANTIAYITAVDGTLNSSYTYSTWKTAIQQLVNDCRTLGLQLHVEAMGAYTVGGTYLPGFTASALFVPLQQAITDVFNPNADVIASIEAGVGETDLGGSGAETISVSLASMAKAATSIPIVLSVSDNGMNCPSVFASSAADLIQHNFFGYTTATDYQTMTNTFKNGLNTSGGKPIYIGSCQQQSGTLAARQSFTANALQAFFGHPDSQGLMLWGAQGPGTSGTFNILTTPSNPIDPTLFWADTLASTTFASWGGLNRNLVFNVTNTGATISSTAADISLTASTQDLTTPTTASFNITTALLQVCSMSLTGLISLSGDVSSSYTISFSALNLDTSTRYTIGTALVLSGSPSNQAINMTGVLPLAGNYTFSIRAQRTAGSVNATVTSLTAKMAIGSALADSTPNTSFPGRLFGNNRALLPMAAAGILIRNPVVSRRNLLGGP